MFRNTADVMASAPPTAQVITETCKQIGIKHYVEDIPHSTRQARLHWLGDRQAEKTVLYFHGGGFGVPAFEGHVKFVGKTIEKVKQNGVDLNVAMLEYALTPAAKYPVQITQAAEALHFLLDRGHDPSNIIIGGDSAGGNLVLALSSIILHGFDGVRPFTLNDKLAGAIIISGWVSYDTEAESMTTNDIFDVVSHKSGTSIHPAYVSDDQRNNYSEPIRAGAAWWIDFPAKRILNVYGGHEVFRDDIVLVGQQLQDAGNDVESVESPMHVHADCILDAQTGFAHGEMAETIWDFLSGV
ncbi:unnamed protein product [Zymoseptoria tritici ST99CH_1A5]|uniref:Alpha/beta hydrolase fold-3 domain-containing protein n=3 Tax=Zymoseptoria tritici TaxID=1047171 RepID=A0A1X7S908_ZYMT9|nr:unnamed protein product [Zymoseptoria tritici ST99CH_3D7]SMR61832.1 unnamed protein product [Zymoseptoria tritici ST99CH_1E4]SMR64333.1 unnamed protein product [Zymoseptoria tritici ST99CH_3D1]SMY29677.1 unnamed protein product [Zymoseptoria tritici ST99CH_1A5]